MELPKVYMLPLSNLRKILTDPPQYILTIDSHEVALTLKQFLNYKKFRDRIEQILDIVLPPKLDKEKWDKIREELYASQELVAAPEETVYEEASYEEKLERSITHHRKPKKVAKKVSKEIKQSYSGVKTYVFQSVEFSKRLKIGFSIGPENRLKQVAAGSPEKLELLQVINKNIEKELHKRFEKYRVHHEWFEPHPEVLEYLESLKKEDKE